MLTINNVATQDAYAEALTLGPVAAAQKVAYLVANAAAIVQLAGYSEDKTIQPWSDEILITPTTGEFQRIQGMRFKSAIAGSPAQVVAQLVEPGDPIPVGGTPFTQVLSSSGSITPLPSASVIYDKLLTAPAANFDTGLIIPAGARVLKVNLYGRSDVAASNVFANFQFNGDVAGDYEWEYMQVDNAGAVTGSASGGVVAIQGAGVPGALGIANVFGEAHWEMSNYDNAIGHKTLSGTNDFTTDVSILFRGFGGRWRSTAPVQRIVCSPGGGNWIAGSRFTVELL